MLRKVVLIIFSDIYPDILYFIIVSLSMLITFHILFSVEKLLEIRYIIAATELRGHNNSILYCPISDISYNGHMFLKTIRPKSIWEATKSKAKQIGGMSIHSLSMIASAIMQCLASNPDFIQICGSAKLNKIIVSSRAVKTAVFGVVGAVDDVGKNYKCGNCGSGFYTFGIKSFL